MTDIATASVYSTLLIQAIVGSVIYVVFECVRNNKEVYAPKLRSKPSRCPEEPPSGIFGWVKPILALNDEDTLRMTGLDGMVFLRFLRMSATIMLSAGIFGLIILVPVYGTAPRLAGVSGIAMYTMGNIQPGGDRLWAPLFAMWIFTLLFLYLIKKEYEAFVELRQQFMRDGDPDVPDQQLFSVMIENIPQQYRSSEKLAAFFTELFPDQVYGAKMAMKYEALLEVAAERKAALVGLEKAVATREADEEKAEPMLQLNGDGKPALVGICCGKREVEAIPYWTAELERLNKAVADLKQQVKEVDNHAPEEGADEEQGGAAAAAAAEKEVNKGADGEDAVIIDESCRTATGFVTFTSKRAQAAAYQLTVLHHSYPELRAVQAGSNQDVIWANLSFSTNYISVASTFTKIMYYMGLLFWAAVLSFIAAVSQLENLETFLPFLKSLPIALYSILQGQLPVIALIVFIALLPVIMTLVSTKIERRKTISEVKDEVVVWLFAYQIANVYLMLLAGSVLGAIKEIIDNPFSIVNLLASALPGVATFFINFFITLGLSGIPLELLRIGPLVILKLFRSLFDPKALTRRDLIEGPLANFDINYAVIIPKMMYALCIGMTYFVIAPILVAIIGVLFAGYYIMWKYMLCYVVVPTVQSGGKMWYKMFGFSMTGLMASTITMIGYMGIKVGPIQTALLIPLPVVVYISWNILDAKFQRFSSDMAHSQAVVADFRTGEGSSADKAAHFDEDFFLPPPLCGAAGLSPLPYRENGTELLDENGFLNKVYHPKPAGVATVEAETNPGAMVEKKTSTMEPLEITDVEDGGNGKDYQVVPSSDNSA